METFQAREMLDNFGIKPGRPINYSCLFKMVETIGAWYGPFWGRCIMDFFMPCEKMRYQFIPNSWEQFEVEWAA